MIGRRFVVTQYFKTLEGAGTRVPINYNHDTLPVAMDRAQSLGRVAVTKKVTVSVVLWDSAEHTDGM